MRSYLGRWWRGNLDCMSSLWLSHHRGLRCRPWKTVRVSLHPLDTQINSLNSKPKAVSDSFHETCSPGDVEKLILRTLLKECPHWVCWEFRAGWNKSGPKCRKVRSDCPPPRTHGGLDKSPLGKYKALCVWLCYGCRWVRPHVMADIQTFMVRIRLSYSLNNLRCLPKAYILKICSQARYCRRGDGRFKR